MKNSSHFQVGTGMTSVLMIFVVLCLTTFGVLSYSTANADLNMTNKNADYVAQYYQADSKAQEIISDIDIKLKSLKDDDESEYMSSVKQYLESSTVTKFTVNASDDGMTAEFSVELNDEQSINVKILIHDKDFSKRYDITSYCLQQGDSWTNIGEDIPDLWDGEA